MPGLRQRRSPRRAGLSVLACAAAILALGAGGARGYSFDAKRMAMGGSGPPRSARLSGDNPAYSIVPERYAERGFLLPVPLGLFALMADPPVFDSEDPDFDALKLANLLANPPFHLDLREPAALDGTLTIDLGANALRVYWEDADLLIPKEPLDLAMRLDRFSVGYGREARGGVWRVEVNPYLDGSVRAELDDNLYGLLTQGDSLRADTDYALNEEARGIGGLSWKLTFAKRLADRAESEIYVAGGPKLITAFGMADQSGAFTVTTGLEDIASETLDLDQVSTLRSADGSAGVGLGFDLGIAARRGIVDVGVGVRDLATSVRFGKTKVERTTLVETPDGGSDTETVTIATGESHTYHVKPYWTLNGAVTLPNVLFVSVVKIRPHRSSLHLGSEFFWHGVAIRAGAQRDAESRWQVSGGCGWKLNRFELNLALETHDRYIQDERGLALGLSLNI